MQSDAELNRLFNEMLIGVTQFMRDPEVFERLANDIVPDICKDKDHEDCIRIWVPACATGEDAYSMAILFLEGLQHFECGACVQVFATDLDERALAVARAGVYSQLITKHLSQKRLERFFVKQDHGYKVDKPLREVCIFSKHDIIKDPPFSKFDLLLCRNLLVYLTSDVQARLIPIFHHTLRPDGILVLGPSETTTGFEELFETVDRQRGIYKRSEAITPRIEFPSGRDGRPSNHHESRDAFAGQHRQHDIGRQVERYLLDRYAPPHVVVNHRYQVVYFSADTGAYLEHAAGVPDASVIDMARHGLRMHLRAALEQAARERKSVARDEVRVKTNGGYQTIRLKVRPVTRNRESMEHLMVIFERSQSQVGQAAPATFTAERLEPDNEESLVGQLEVELSGTGRNPQTTIEDLESANAKLTSTNEELHSTAEELDAAQEELHSLNEELKFSNEQLHRHADELARTNSEIQSLLEITQIAMLLLDRQLAVRFFTPTTKYLYHLLPGDTGRSILDIRATHDYDKLAADAAQVLRTLEPVERNLRVEAGQTYIMRMLPHQTVDNTVEGLVLKFVDVTNVERSRQEIEKLKHEQEQRAVELDAMLNRLPVGIAIWNDAEGRRGRVNPAAAAVLEIEPGDNLQSFSSVKLYRGEAVLSVNEHPIRRAFDTGQAVATEILSIHRTDGARLDIEVSAWPVKDKQGSVSGVVGMFIDHSARLREFRLRAAQQTAIADLGTLALLTNDVGSVMRRVAESVREVLDIARCEVWRLDAHTSQLWLQASAGGQESDPHHVRVSADPDMLAGYAVAAEQSETVEDAQAHFPYPAYLDDQGMACSMTVVIRTANQVWGALSAQDDHARQFLPYETNFLQSVADLLGALQRKQFEIGHGEDQRRQAFAEAEDRMHQAERLASLGTLAAGIAHEVNNPLNSILMNAELGLLTLEGATHREKLSNVLQTIIKEAKRGGSITRNVLQFSKTDRYTPKSRADLNSLIARAHDHVAPVLHEHNATLEVKLDKNLPRLEINQIALEQALINMISNAAQAGASKILVHTEQCGGHALIVITDDGNGIPRQQIEHIFDPFYTTRRGKGGSGLGLSLVHRIVADHNGTVEAHSKPEKGAEFVVRLPLVRGSADASGSEN